MKIHLNISPAKMGNSFIQQFFMQQEAALAGNRVYFLKNQFRDEHPHYWMKKPVVTATRTGRIDREGVARAAGEFFGFVDRARFDTVCHLFTGALYGDPTLCTLDKGVAALETLKAIVGDRDVQLFTYIRRQDKFLESYYVQKVQGGSGQGFDEFMDSVKVEDISWNELLSALESLFGRERIEVVPFETIYEGEEPFLRRCAASFTDPDILDYTNLAGLPKNRSYSDIALNIARTANPLLSAEEQRLLRTFLQTNFSNATHPRARLLSDAARRDILAMHRDGNAAVIARYCPELDPAQLGYQP